MAYLNTQRFSHILCLVLVASLMTACVSRSHYQQEEWPAHIPDLAFFEAEYARDSNNQTAQSQEEYFKWVKRFYLGWALYPNGWDWLTDKVLKQTPNEEERGLLKEGMYTLGGRIGAEWAKDGAYRKINSSHLMTWGNVLKVAIKKGQQYDLFLKISSDTKALLVEEIKPSAIHFDRYIPDSGSVVIQDETEFDPFDA